MEGGYYGQFLDYPEAYDPWQTSIDKLCDHWSEWDGMQDFVAQMKAKEAAGEVPYRKRDFVRRY